MLPTFAILCAMLAQPGATTTPLRADEQVVLFPGTGWQDAGGTWQVEVRGWVYEPETDSPLRNAALIAFAKTLGLKDGDATSTTFRARASLFLADNERGKRLAIAVPGPTSTDVVVTPDSDAAGHFIAAMPLHVSPEPSPDVQRRRAYVPRPEGDPRDFCTTVFLIPPHGLSVVSDIDDTVKVSNVLDRAALIRGVFLEDYKPAPGMAAFYARLNGPSVAFHYVSASPWQLHGPLADFLIKAGFPDGTFEMRQIRAKDESVLSLLDNPVEFKRAAIERLFERWPHRTFVLVGDSGEKDPEVYLSLAKAKADMVKKVYIRNVTAEGRTAERYTALTESLPPDLLVVFDDPAGLELPQGPDVAPPKHP